MGKMSVTGMVAVETEKAKRAEKIRTLTSQPFNGSSEQIDSLKKHIDEFESNINKMYIYQALSKGLAVWGASFLIARIVPIPEIVNSFLNACLVVGISNYILEQFSISDFHAQLSEMKQLYNWALKNGKASYDEETPDNTKALLNPQIQRMMKLMAPICSTDFMIAWPAEGEQSEQENGYVSNAISLVYSVVSAPFSLFSKAPQPSGDQPLQLRELKASIQTRKLDLNEYTGFKQAIDYFMTKATNTDYKQILWTKWDDLKNMAPAPIAAMLTTPKMS